MYLKIEEVIRKIKTYMQGTYGDSFCRMVLFGSHARGTAGQESDIDLAVILKGAVDAVMEIKRNNLFLSDLSLEYDEDISCLFFNEQQFNEAKTPFLAKIHEEGVGM